MHLLLRVLCSNNYGVDCVSSKTEGLKSIFCKSLQDFFLLNEITLLSGLQISASRVWAASLCL